ncbi:HAMP domain-containing sensor histidine kinase [Leptolyngbya sp. FACHB-711]|uniref:sensor histidine kinase n=1 Tax=unclassified Leptolyngbya TaxID=2650499 RepID=UPI001689A812|nr:HAMP domain-containing sensor histidine kinase [Leptolyngbya sp. FACHB-711]MBD1848733.1 HAMP domain-containing histidine kinase [Cyanobacteria bacterium FACHB-502]MBD2024144.1 HAMP domain-containing histidine kinase [Leptolyngbya sp. FACHB-711]
MIDFGKLMHQQADTIVQQWVEAVRQDEQIQTTGELTYKAIQNSLPKVLNALATILSEEERSDVQTLIETTLEHGIVRADQGFDPGEIAREYRLLRSIIFEVIEAELLQASAAELLRAVRLIDTVIDEAIARCFQSYTESRLHELEQLQSQLKLTNQELTRLVRASKANLSELAHELRTPLTSIIGYSDLFLRQHRQDGSTRDSVPNLESIDRVLQAGRQLLRLINDSLEISRYDAGQMQLQLSPVNICELVQTTVDMVQPLVAARNLQLQFDCDPALNHILTDSLRLQQIVTNLLSNAIRYTEQGEIHVICRAEAINLLKGKADSPCWSLTVADTGLGIASEEQQRIFEPYVQSNLQKLRDSESTGLGLAVVSRLVKLFQGEIHLESQFGIGSTFILTFPLLSPDGSTLASMS